MPPPNAAQMPSEGIRTIVEFAKCVHLLLHLRSYVLATSPRRNAFFANNTNRRIRVMAHVHSSSAHCTVHATSTTFSPERSLHNLNSIGLFGKTLNRLVNCDWSRLECIDLHVVQSTDNESDGPDLILLAC